KDEYDETDREENRADDGRKTLRQDNKYERCGISKKCARKNSSNQEVAYRQLGLSLGQLHGFLQEFLGVHVIRHCFFSWPRDFSVLYFKLARQLAETCA